MQAALLVDEAMQRYPFLHDIPLDNTHIPLEVRLSELDEAVLNRSLLEDASEAAGHFNVKKDLYVIRDGRVHSVDVKRKATRIYPPEYLHPGKEFPDDEMGESENVRRALNRQDLTRASHVVLYTRGSNGYGQNENCLLIASLEPASV